jgi:hypothetical protein
MEDLKQEIKRISQSFLVKVSCIVFFLASSHSSYNVLAKFFILGFHA